MNTRRLLHSLVIPALAIAALLALLALLHATLPAAHAGPPPQDAADATLRIINDSEQTICQVFISSVTSDEWGDDWLGENETIPPGKSRAFDVAANDYCLHADQRYGGCRIRERNC